MAVFKNKLRGREKKFCDEYLLNGRQGTKAALHAGYSPKSAAKISDNILRKPHIKDYIENKLIKIEQELDVTFDWKVKKMKHVVDSYIPNDATPHVDEARVAVSTIAELNKMQGHYSPEKRINLNLNDDVHIKEVKELNQQYLEKFKQPY